MIDVDVAWNQLALAGPRVIPQLFFIELPPTLADKVRETVRAAKSDPLKADAMVHRF
jgi:hypothetical protein